MKGSTRRGFLGELAAGIAATGLTGGCVLTRSAPRFDDNLAVFLSDCHVCGDESLKRWLYTQSELRRRVCEILAMRPLPGWVVCLGDISFGHGDPRDYAVAAALFKPLQDAGIRLAFAMGNHDRRKPFRDAFPGFGDASPVENRLVTVAQIPLCDLILLDSLDGDGGPVGGSLDEAQQKWLADALPKWPKPVFVCAHHGLNELSVNGRNLLTLLKCSPNVAGYIHGHVHRWARQWSVNWEGGQGPQRERTIRWMSLPSAGLWGDIGYVTFRTRPEGAVASLVQHGFWFNDPTSFGEVKPSVWKTITEENQGERCAFPFH